MLLLIRAHGHHVGLVQQDIGGHEHRIGKQAGVDVVRVLGRLILELRHAAQLAHISEAVKNPGKLGVHGHMTLGVDDILLGIQAAGNIERGQLRRAAGGFYVSSGFSGSLRSSMSSTKRMQQTLMTMSAMLNTAKCMNSSSNISTT